jgi:hypothetical protein
MIATIVLVAVLSAVTGAMSKWSDLFNDDGLRSRWGMDLLSGVIWGATGGALVLINSQVAAVWCATVLYWFLRIKLDHLNHAVAGVIILAAGLFAASTNRIDLSAMVALLLWLTVSGYLNTYAKQVWAGSRQTLGRFLRLRLRYYVGPFVLTVVMATPLPTIGILAGMCGTELVTAWGGRRLSPSGSAIKEMRPFTEEGKAA